MRHSYSCAGVENNRTSDSDRRDQRIQLAESPVSRSTFPGKPRPRVMLSERETTEEQPIELEVLVEDLSGATVISLSGELDVSTLATLGETLALIDLDGRIALRLDLSTLRFLDSTGIGTMVATARRVRAAGGTFSTICPAGPVRRVFEITGLVEYLQLDP